jgi:hypothetical protein
VGTSPASTTPDIYVESTNATATGRRMLSVRVSGDTQDRFFIDWDGKINWGAGGAAASDVSLIRTAAGGGLTVNGDLNVTGDFTQTGLGIGAYQFVRKTADTSYTSTTTLANDPHLFTASLPASSIWQVEVIFGFTAASATNGGVKNNFTFPSGASLKLWVPSPTASTSYAITAADTWTIPDSGVSHGGMYFGILTIGATAGIFRVQWAQNSSSATATTIQANSYFKLRRVA